MKKSARTLRVGAPAALMIAGAVALTGCSGSSDKAASSSTTAPITTSTSAASAPSSTPVTTSSTPPASPTTATTTSAAAPAVNPNLVTACVNANTRSNSAVTGWNAAVKSQKSADLNSAGKNFAATATYLRTLTAKPGDKTFTGLITNVAKDFDTMATARANRKSVSTTQYNADATKLRTYCQNKIQAG